MQGKRRVSASTSPPLAVDAQTKVSAWKHAGLVSEVSVMSLPTALDQMDLFLTGNAAVHFTIMLRVRHYLRRGAPDFGLLLQPPAITPASPLTDIRVYQFPVYLV